MVALFVLPALSHPAPEPQPESPATAPFALHYITNRSGSFGFDMLTVLTHSLRANDRGRRDRPTQEPLHLAALTLTLMAALELCFSGALAHRAIRRRLALVPFCGHGPPTAAGI